MSRRRFSDIPAIVDHLLERHERASGSSLPIAYVDHDGFGSVDQRDAFDEGLLALERRGAVKLLRSGGKFDRVVTGARLVDASALYGWAGRRPSGEVAAESLGRLMEEGDLPEEARQLVAEIAAAWSRGVGHIGVRPGEAATLRQVIALAAALRQRVLEPVAGDTDYRTFSRLAAGDSKALERNVGAVSSAFRRMFPAEGTELPADPSELFASAGVTRLPHPILVRGPVSVGGTPFRIAPFVGIPTDRAEEIALDGAVGHTLLIENFASFVRHVREIVHENDCLVVYTGGFPSRPTLRTIVRLTKAAGAPVHHWGDMDPGGLRIFLHLELSLRAVGIELHPHMMSKDLLLKFGTEAEGDLRLPAGMATSGLADLAAAMESARLVHEQEEFAPTRPGAPL